MSTQRGLVVGATVALLCSVVLRFAAPGFILGLIVVMIVLSPFATAFAKRADGGRFIVAALYLGLIGGLVLSFTRSTS
ncbi:MAG: hypothetical protein HYX51_08885 [Chloroflexi bacterium]|nr:hypothetical protein [Chloroflexota bacterium]